VNEEPAVNYFEFRDVCKSFDDRLVLDHVSFTVKRGETCVIMGRSGVGKSVSLKHIMGFLKADSGRIFIDGQDVTNFKEEDFEGVRRRVTMVFQSGALFDSLTVGENIAFPLDGQPGLKAEDIDEYVMKIAHMVEVEDVLDKLPSELSTGMKRAVAIGAVVTALVFLLYALGFLLAAGASGIATVLPWWAALLIVGGALVVLALGLVALAALNLRSAGSVVPEDTKASVKEDVRSLRQQSS